MKTKKQFESIQLEKFQLDSAKGGSIGSFCRTYDPMSYRDGAPDLDSWDDKLIFPA
jgi:hypothetical protein